MVGCLCLLWSPLGHVHPQHSPSWGVPGVLWGQERVLLPSAHTALLLQGGHHH